MLRLAQSPRAWRSESTVSGQIGMPLKGFFRTKKQICGRPSMGSAAFGGGTNLAFVREAGMARCGPLGSLAGSDGCLRLATKQVHGVRNRTRGLPVQAQSRPAARHTPLSEAAASGAGIPKPTGSVLDERHLSNVQSACHLLGKIGGKPQLVIHFRFMIGYHVPCPLKGLPANWSVDCRICKSRAEGS